MVRLPGCLSLCGSLFNMRVLHPLVKVTVSSSSSFFFLKIKSLRNLAYFSIWAMASMNGMLTWIFFIISRNFENWGSYSYFFNLCGKGIGGSYNLGLLSLDYESSLFITSFELSSILVCSGLIELDFFGWANSLPLLMMMAFTCFLGFVSVLLGKVPWLHEVRVLAI